VRTSLKIVPVGGSFALASFAMTICAAFASWFGHGGRPSLNAADMVVYFADWPIVVVHGTDFYVTSLEALIVNTVGWAAIGVFGVICGDLIASRLR